MPTPANKTRCSAWGEPTIGPFCNASTTCCGQGSMGPMCLDSHQKCCTYRLSAAACKPTDSCCGHGDFAGSNANCCPKGTSCCTAGMGAGMNICVKADQICCGTESNSNTWACPKGTQCGDPGTESCITPTITVETCDNDDCGPYGYCSNQTVPRGCTASPDGTDASVLYECVVQLSRTLVNKTVFAHSKACKGPAASSVAHPVGKCFNAEPDSTAPSAKYLSC
jgi:hypothetical protein